MRGANPLQQGVGATSSDSQQDWPNDDLRWGRL